MLKSAIGKTKYVCWGAYDNPITYHPVHVNNYDSLYPEGHEVILVPLSAMKPFVCITYLVLYTTSESHRVMSGTVHEYTIFSTTMHSLSHDSYNNNEVDGINDDRWGKCEGQMVGTTKRSKYR